MEAKAAVTGRVLIANNGRFCHTDAVPPPPPDGALPVTVEPVSPSVMFPLPAELPAHRIGMVEFAVVPANWAELYPSAPPAPATQTISEGPPAEGNHPPP